MLLPLTTVVGERRQMRYSPSPRVATGAGSNAAVNPVRSPVLTLYSSGDIEKEAR